MTPRRAARAAAQPLALDEAVAWLARAAPAPPELVAALAGRRLAELRNPACSPNSSSCACCCVLRPDAQSGVMLLMVVASPGSRVEAAELALCRQSFGRRRRRAPRWWPLRRRTQTAQRRLLTA